MFAVFDIWDFLILLALAIGSFWYFKGKDFTIFSKTREVKKDTSANINTRNFVEKMILNNKHVIIFYGSQTGTAEDYANGLAKELQEYGLESIAADLDDYDMDNLNSLPSDRFIIFLLATYGEGEPTDNAAAFYSGLMESDENLENVHFALFGLGNTTYEHYNKVGTDVFDKLVKLKAAPLIEKGLGDADKSMEEDFLTWKETLIPELCIFFKIPPIKKNRKECIYKLIELDFTDIKPKTRWGSKNPNVYDANNPYYTKIVGYKNLTPYADRVCMKIDLQIEKDLAYQTGDHLGVLPENDPDKVLLLATLLGICEKLDEMFNLIPVDPSSKKSIFPCPTTHRIALTNFIDILAIPKTSTVALLADYAENEGEKDHLLSLIGTTNKERYYDYIINPCRTIINILQEHSSIKIPVNVLYESLPKLQVRYYSISSSSLISPETVSITAVRLEYKTTLGAIRKGIATHFLFNKSQELNSGIPVFIRKSNFRLPKNPQLPVIMIGPGTGIAPFFAFIQERAFKKSNGQPIGPTVLYFGCRNESRDFMYKDELTTYVESGLLTLHTAFSRDQEKKIYVQNRLLENGQEMYELVNNKNAVIYVCGDAKNMAREVNKAWCDIFEKHGSMSQQQAVDKVKQLRSKGRYLEDIWS
ncbi:NADPH-cytochrome P-450 reductase [Rozella allomycis CSF55]|uniref:NADPH--hemoprotein reductase n=1 Tax=Rozella allomycis (strain CSF55) TaxID=988480 RepID=A0A4P9YNQ8_ROZAC|nr:NADPH-cytochrome P-450 reductase [Rozella allomycis CSF55]